MEEKVKAEKVEKVKKLVVYKEFEFKGQVYREGDVFIPPVNLERDSVFEEFRAVEKRRNTDGSREDLGICFTELGEKIDPKDRSNDAERHVYRHILPLKEA